MLIHNQKVRALAGVPNALQDALGILGIRRVSGSAGQIGCGLIFHVAGFDAKLIYARPFAAALPPGVIRPDALAIRAIVPFGVCR